MKKSNVRPYKLSLRRQPTRYYDNYYCFWRTRSVQDAQYELLDGTGCVIQTMCANQFEKATGQRLEPGSKEKVTLSFRRRKVAA